MLLLLSMEAALPRRQEALARLRATLPGRNIADLAVEHAITIERNKGWVGQTIERLAHLENSSRPQRDGLDFELKSTLLFERDGAWHPRETIKVTQLNPQLILEETFETSRLWQKLASLIVVGYEVTPQEEYRALKVDAIDVTNPILVNGVREFWQDVQGLVLAGEIAQHFNVGKSEDWIQLRPVGDGKQVSTCPVSGEKFPARAFYLTKRFLRLLLGL